MVHSASSVAVEAKRGELDARTLLTVSGVEGTLGRLLLIGIVWAGKAFDRGWKASAERAEKIKTKGIEAFIAVGYAREGTVERIVCDD